MKRRHVWLEFVIKLYRKRDAVVQSLNLSEKSKGKFKVESVFSGLKNNPLKSTSTGRLSAGTRFLRYSFTSSLFLVRLLLREIIQNKHERAFCFLLISLSWVKSFFISELCYVRLSVTWHTQEEIKTPGNNPSKNFVIARWHFTASILWRTRWKEEKGRRRRRKYRWRRRGGWGGKYQTPPRNTKYSQQKTGGRR